MWRCSFLVRLVGQRFCRVLIVDIVITKIFYTGNLLFGGLLKKDRAVCISRDANCQLLPAVKTGYVFGVSRQAYVF